MPKEFHEQREGEELDRQKFIRENLEGSERLMMMIEKGISLGPVGVGKSHEESGVLAKYNDFNYNKSLALGV